MLAFETVDILLRRNWRFWKKAHRVSLFIHSNVFRGKFGWKFSCFLHDVMCSAKRAYFGHQPNVKFRLRDAFCLWDEEMNGHEEMAMMQEDATAFAVVWQINKVSAARVAIEQGNDEERRRMRAAERYPDERSWA